MTFAYMPFTYLSEATAHRLTSLFGPVVIYQPLTSIIPEGLTALASEGLVEIRTPMTWDEDRLRAALTEFTDWARTNAGKSTPGADYFSARQGEIPFFDETTINRIRSDIKRYPSPPHHADQTESEFSARLFLALAQENDLATDRLEHDLNRFKALEKDFLNTLKDADDVGFNRQAPGGEIWRDDPGGKLTGQRIRAWATLAAADNNLPEVLITTSSTVIDTMIEDHGDALRLEKLIDMRLGLPPANTTPFLGSLLADLATQANPQAPDLAPLTSVTGDAAVSATLFKAANRTPATVLRQIGPTGIAPSEEDQRLSRVRHTLIALVQG